jgi:hypothetical protein
LGIKIIYIFLKKKKAKKLKKLKKNGGGWAFYLFIFKKRCPKWCRFGLG